MYARQNRLLQYYYKMILINKQLDFFETYIIFAKMTIPLPH